MLVKEFKSILLGQIKAHGFEAGKAKALVLVNGMEILDEEGNAVEIDKIVLESAAPAQEEEAAKEANEKSLKALNANTKALNAFNSKSHFSVEATEKVVKQHSLGNVLKTVMSNGNKQIVVKAPTTFNSEAANADGAYLLSDQIYSQVTQPVLEGGIVGRMTQIPVAGTNLNLLSIPWVADTLVSTKNLANQGTDYTEKKLAYAQAAIVLDTIGGVVPVSNELLEDAPQVAAQIQTALSSGIQRTVESGIVNQIITSAACIDVARAGAGAISEDDIHNMFARLWIGGYDLSKTFWMYHPSCTKDIMDYRDVNTGIDKAPFGTLLGLPLVPTPYAKPLGTEGDLILCDGSKYAVGVKGGTDAKFDVSPDVFFKANSTGFRATMRMAYSPMMLSTITENGYEYGFMVRLGDGTT